LNSGFQKPALTSAISAAGNNGTVQFGADCSITLSSTITLSQNVTIDGNGHAVTVSGGHTGGTGTGVQVFVVNSGVSVTLNDLTVANGNSFAGNGGGVFNSGTLTVTNSTFSSNSTRNGSGGGIENRGTLSVSDSTFSCNTSSLLGGGIDSSGGTLTITNSTFRGNGNGAFNGGGIGNGNGGTLTVTNSTFSGNGGVGRAYVRRGLDDPH
jgi:hypothetical protein